MSARPAIFETLHADHVAASQTAVLLLHGLCSTPDELLSVQGTLHRLGYAVHPMSIDGYSFDGSTARQEATPYEQWIDTIETRINALRTTHRRIVLIGISAGASLALGAAIRCGERIDALLLMSTTLQFDGWAIPRTQWLLPLALYTPIGRFWKYRERAPYGVKNERVRAWIERDLRTRRISSAGSSIIDIGHLREHDRLIRHVRRHLGDVVCGRVLALHAREDEVASVANLDLLARGLRCSAFRSVVLTNSYHMITIDNDRQQVVHEAVEFVRAVAHGAD
ncbi:MAG: alpha/beta fold hydrolase [Comamonadaceae bacterium]|nr:MAG: alpha/beta fold hydrolase [Comamonadaceae bacterium]